MYCGPVCRSLAAYELRRLTRRLQDLETRLSWLRHRTEDDFLNAYQRRYAEKRRAEEIEALEAEIAEAEARMSALLAEGRGKTLPDPGGPNVEG